MIIQKKANKISSFHILILSIPAILQMCLKMIVGISDKIMVGRLGSSVVTGVGLSDQLFFFLLIIFSILSSGLSILASQYIGANKYEQLRKLFGTVIISSFIIAILLNIIILLFPDLFFKIMGAESEVIYQGIKYLKITSFSIISMILTFAITGLFRAFTYNKAPMIASLSSSILNIILNYIFIFQYNMGIEGAAYATLISRNFELLISFFILKLKKNKLNVSISDSFKFSFDDFIKILKLGIPLSIDMLLWQISVLALSKIILSLGTTAGAINELLKIMLSFLTMPIYGIAITTSSLIGQELGKKDFFQAKFLAKKSIKLCLIIGLILNILILIIHSNITYIIKFEVFEINTAKKSVFIYNFFIIFQMLNMVFANILRAGGDTKSPIYISTISMYIFGIPLAYFLGIKFNIYGVIIGYYFGEIIKYALFNLRYLQGKWLKNLI